MFHYLFHLYNTIERYCVRNAKQYKTQKYYWISKLEKLMRPYRRMIAVRYYEEL